jgi:DNA-binding beta-propeller fold protein YncE
MTRHRLLLGSALLLLPFSLVSPQGQSAGPAAGARRGGPVAPRFVVDAMWPQPMPDHYILGWVTGVTVDAHDNVWIVNLSDTFDRRTESGLASNPPTGECCMPAPNVLEYDPAGTLIAHWGGGRAGAAYQWPEMAAGIGVDPGGNVWIGGMGGADSHVLEFTGDGKLVAEFGTGARPAAAAGRAAEPDTAYAGVSPGRGGRGGRGRGRGRGPVRAEALPANSNSMDSFGGAARFSFDAKAQEVYVADGFRNHRVAVLDMATGAIKRYWGAYGNKPDDSQHSAYDPDAQPARQFGIVRCAALSHDGYVYVCDATNDRIQVFTALGKFVSEARVAPRTLGEGSVWDITFSRDARQQYIYVADGMNMKIHVLERASLKAITSFGDGGRQPGEFYAVDGVGTDSHGNLYTAETFEGKRVQKFITRGVGPITAADSGVVWPGSGRNKP